MMQMQAMRVAVRGAAKAKNVALKSARGATVGRRAARVARMSAGNAGALHVQSFSTAQGPSAHGDAAADDAYSNAQSSFASPEERILESALNNVALHGWTIEALAAGAQNAGYPSVAHGMFPRGAIELVDYFMDKNNEALRQKLIENTDLPQSMSVTDRLKFGVRTRLELVAPVVSSWPQAMALGALPENASSTMQRLGSLVDEIWYFAGDKSTDASWYTKRAVLLGIYASTELFMLSDQSPNFQETWAFLDRRVDETIALGEVPQTAGDVVGMVGLGVQSLFSAVTSLAGPLASQAVRSTPLGSIPNPISAVGNVVPPQVASTLASGFLPNPFDAAKSAIPTPPSPFDGKAFEPVDLKEIDEELEKLGGNNAQRN
ncbi:TPA: hypothetical protein N0F65_009370 [Lagenidium giganteum]|uniref:Ubiquinone biosynthesis protein n=1 Tax=Lagenidium giganteum TaxID=4803 RepID=A0AAV2ZGA4_9STRA|nr:TPA: hypothetical protein N0F65_009370 [Lagenidium giganteum]